MIPLKLNIKIVSKHKSRPKRITRRNIEGEVIENEDGYFVKCNLKDIEGLDNGITTLPITEDSYSCRGKTDVWTKDSNGKYIRIIRFPDEARVFGMPKCYIPFRAGYAVKGNLIRENDKLYFRIIGCYHPLYEDNKLKKINKNPELYDV